MKSLGAYVAELERRLQGKLPREVAEVRLREVRAHLEEAVRTEGGDAALRRFGTPAATARAIVRQARGYDARSAASLAWIPGLVFSGAFVLQHVWGALMPVRIASAGSDLSEALSAEAIFRMGLWISSLGMLLFVAYCFRTRRWLVVPVTVWFAFSWFLTAVAFWVLTPNIAPPDKAKRIVSYRNQLATPGPDERMIDLWREGDPPTWEVPVAGHMPTFFTVPGLPILLMRDHTTYDVRLFHGSKGAARRAWNAYGEG